MTQLNNTAKGLFSMAALTIPVAITFAQDAEPQDRPNILWLTYEDTSPEFVGCYGNPGARTMSMDSLAALPGGMRFERAYSNSTVSSASRSCLITGIDVNTLGTGNHRYNRPVPEDVHAFPYYLRQAGYYTTNNVKTDYNISNPDFISDGWDESSNTAHWRKRPEGKPFFSVFNINYSHQSFASRNTYDSYLKDILAILPEERVTPVTEVVQPPFYKAGFETDLAMARVQNCVNATDMVVGDRLAELRDDGVDDNTIVFIFADHGEGMPRGKTSAYGLGYRVPFIAYFPEKWAHLNPLGSDHVTDREISFIDMAPTILSLAGVTPPECMTGSNIFSTDTPDSRYIHGQRNRIGETWGIDRTIIKGKYVYTRTFCPWQPMVREQGYSFQCDLCTSIRRDLHQGNFTPEQAASYLPSGRAEFLFDREADPWEMNNLAEDPEYQQLLTEFRDEMVRYAKEIGDIGFIPEFDMTRRSEGSTPMEIRKDLDLNRIIESAMIVGEPGCNDKALTMLDDNDPVVRYWGATALYSMTENSAETVEAVRSHFTTETYEPAKLRMAALLYRADSDSGAKALIEDYLVNGTDLLATDAALMIQFMGDKIVDFRDAVAKAKTYWNTNDDIYSPSPAVNVATLKIRNYLESPFSELLATGREVSLQNSFTKGYLACPSEGNTYQTIEPGDDARWVIKETDGAYMISTPDGKKALTLRAATNGSRPTLENVTGDNSQLWRILEYREGFFLESVAGGRRLQVNGQSTSQGAVISQWDWNGKQHFVWKFRSVQSVGIDHVRSNAGAVAEIREVIPSDSGLTVNYSVPPTAAPSLTIYDSAGRILYKVNEGPGSENRQTSLRASVKNGVYFLELAAGTDRSVKKCIFR